jgi:hypothetical protein
MEVFQKIVRFWGVFSTHDEASRVEKLVKADCFVWSDSPEESSESFFQLKETFSSKSVISGKSIKLCGDNDGDFDH